MLLGAYAPRSAAGTVLHQVVRTHLDRFLGETAAATDGVGVPGFIEREFRDFLGCGALGRGFARVRCDDCAFERLVPFSCKARAVCPSCGGRRMAEQAAHLVEAVLPVVPVRQWVLTVPHRLRYRLAFDHALCRAVLGVFIRAVLGWYRRRARRAGIPEGQSGTVTVVQRFGSGLELHVHFHTLGLDGVFAPGTDGTLRFHRLPPPTDAEVARLVATIARRVGRLLRRRGRGDDADGTDPLAAESLALAGLASAAVQGRIALGPRAGARVERLGADPDGSRVEPGRPLQARAEGFDLHAGVTVAGEDRDRLEQLCRYLLRPPIAQERLALRPDGSVLLTLKTPWRDGTSHLCFEPLTLLERLAALTPRPRINLVLYHGILAPRATWRAAAVAYGRADAAATPDGGAAVGGPAADAAPVAIPVGAEQERAPATAGVPVAPASGPATATPPPRDTPPSPAPPRRWRWAALLQRVFAVDVLVCPRCGGRMRVLATIDDPDVVRRILAHLGLAGGDGPPLGPWPYRAP
ncbi:MAG TPA: transposase [Solirubrobacteraceae bacterium]|nr:transposase [Solirubrobacteraceae bacterium]